MQLFTLGLNHRSAPLALRERVAFTEESLTRGLADLASTRPATECAIVSTCNRMELYAAEGDPAKLLDWLAAFHGVRADDIAPHLYTHTQLDAVRHAFRVASGLDSMVLGEPQILGQMKDAVRAAEEAGALGTTLHKLFQRSFGVAKDVRTNTKVGANVVSMAAAAVKLALRIFPTLSDRRVLFIGAGEMIELAATHFAAQNPRSMTVANRTPERGQALAQRLGGESIALRTLPEHLASYDVVVSSTAASLPIIGKGLMERIVRSRKHEPVVMVDLAVPRDIEPEVGALDDVFLYTIDDLAALVSTGSAERLAAVGEAESIIDTQVAQFRDWMHARAAVPLIRVLRDRAEAARQAELDRALKSLGRGEDPRAVLEALSQALTNKLMHAPTQALNDAAAAGTEGDDAADLQEAIARLFRLRAER